MKLIDTSLGVTKLSIWVNLILGLVKVVVGWMGNSKALMADGLHSLVDLSSDVAVVLGLKVASVPRDLNHPYGHHKFASFAQFSIAIMIVLFSVSLIASAFGSLQGTRESGPGLLAFIVAIVSVVSKEILFHLTIRVGRRERSRLIITNAWHHRTDSISSLLTMVAVGTAHWGGESWYFLDSMFAAALGIYMAVIGGRMCLQGINDLVDRAPEEAVIADLREHILPTDGVQGYHQFRARRIGDMIEVDMHLQVDPKISVDCGHNIAAKVRANIMEKHPEVLDVLIHVEPATEAHLRQDKGLGEISAMDEVIGD